MFARLFAKPHKPVPPPSTGGRLVYAVGDIHGRLDVMEPLIYAIAKDSAETNPVDLPLLVFLGDYVDRGPASKGVVDLILRLKAETGVEVRALKGNHEEALLNFLEDPRYGPPWADHGGGATLQSYGVQPPAMRNDAAGWRAARDAFAAALPPEHLEFYRSLELMVTVGDYLFVHAGVRPGVALDAQDERDLLWIRGEFLHAPGPFGKVVVHGHTPTEEPQLMAHRLGVDTGAYATGVLTAVRLDGTGHRVMQARAGQAAAAA